MKGHSPRPILSMELDGTVLVDAVLYQMAASMRRGYLFVAACQLAHPHLELHPAALETRSTGEKETTVCNTPLVWKT